MSSAPGPDAETLLTVAEMTAPGLISTAFSRASQRWHRWILLIVLALLLWPGDARAADTYKLGPTQDTDVRENSGGTSNCGGCSELVTRSHSTGEYRPLYQFDLSTIPSGSRLVSATLRIWVTGAASATVSVYKVTQPWSEYTLTWANSGGVAHDATVVASFTPSQSGLYYDVDVTSLVSQWRTGTPNYGLIMRISGKNEYASYTSREWGTVSQRPELVVISEPAPQFTTIASHTVASDPYNATTNPKAIPSALMDFSFNISNSSPGSPDPDTVVVVKGIPPDTELFVGDLFGAGSGPVTFVQGLPSSNVAYTYTNLSSTTDDIAFSNDNGLSFAYTPVADAQGYDPAVTHIQVIPKGTFAGSTGSGDPDFTLKWRTRVK